MLSYKTGCTVFRLLEFLVLSFQKGYTVLDLKLLALSYQKVYTMLEFISVFVPGGLPYVGVVN